MSTIRVRFFARYAELLGREEAQIDLQLPATVATVVRAVRETLSNGTALPDHPLVAVNLMHAREDAPVNPGDEVALLPPLAGGVGRSDSRTVGP
jgi:molybdopterin converting factor subunit 1